MRDEWKSAFIKLQAEIAMAECTCEPDYSLQHCPRCKLVVKAKKIKDECIEKRPS